MPVYDNKQNDLLMLEYGRMVQRMVQVAIELPDKAQRNQCAHYIIGIMAHMLDCKDEHIDFTHKLWNHLARISGYKLDIDYPVNIVPEEDVQNHPAPMHYPMRNIRRKHYGYLTEQMLRYVSQCDNEEERDELAQLAANHMRQNLYTWNRDAMDEEVVFQDFRSYTQGKVQLPKDMRFAPIVQNDDNLSQVNKNRKKKKNNGWQPLS